MTTKELLGRRLRELRKKGSLTLEQLSESASVDVKYLGDIERGKENPTVAILERVANALNLKVYQLLIFEHEIQGERLLRRRITQALEKCDEKQLQMILKILLALKE